MQVRDSMEVWIEFATSPSSLVSCTWSANPGAIRGDGTVGTYLAPPSPGPAVLVATVSDAEGMALSDSTTIYVFTQYVILKADDLRFDPSSIVAPGWLRFLDYIDQRQISAGVGLIGIEIERGNETFFDLVRELDRSGRIEVWNHGYDHVVGAVDSTGAVYSEFSGTSYEHQRDHLLRTQNLAREKIGVNLRTFGAPGNAFDRTTTRAIDEIEGIDVWLYGDTASRKYILDRSLAIETPIFKPNHDRFAADYDSVRECLTIQIHPKSWDKDGFAQFERIVDFLREREVIFTTPHGYYEKRGKSKRRPDAWRLCQALP